MRVLMLGWEFPPFISGGLGTACHGLAGALTRQGVGILFILPKAESGPGGREWGREAMAGMVVRAVPSALTSPYPVAPGAAARGALAGQPVHGCCRSLLEGGGLRVTGTGGEGGYEGDLVTKIAEYAARCEEIAREEEFDLIHAHDWVTFPCAAAIAARTGRPLVVHVHSTEFDRSGERINPAVYGIERAGMHAASAVLAVSRLTMRTVVERYEVPPQKVRVVHNGVVPLRLDGSAAPVQRSGKVVLFLGRLTMQKGPGFFLQAARRVLEVQDGVRFVMAGWGDLGPQTVEQAAGMGLGTHVRFTGFLRGLDVQRAYRMADVYVMPSVSEPFGLTALEAIQHNVPVVLSKTSGVAEVLHRGALKVDYWDIDGMADRVVGVLRHPVMADALRRAAAEEVRGLTWDRAAKECLRVYEQQIHRYN